MDEWANICELFCLIFIDSTVGSVNNGAEPEYDYATTSLIKNETGKRFVPNIPSIKPIALESFGQHVFECHQYTNRKLKEEFEVCLHICGV